MTSLFKQPPIAIYAKGLVAISVCADNEVPAESIERFVNGREPTGLDHGWAVSSDPTFKGGEPNPCPCNHEPESRTHYLLSC